MEKQQELEIKQFMLEKIAEGISLSEIQKQVNQRYELKLTYMDIRILASELDNVDWNANDPKAQEKAKAEAEEKKKAEAITDDSIPGDGEASGVGQTVVELSKLVRPGTALSGTVKFANGSTADWYIDNYGQLGLDNLNGAKPSKEDIIGFQNELQKILGR